MGTLQCQKCNINLSPVIFAFVLEVIESLCDMMMTIIYHNVMISSTKYLICFIYSLIPFLSWIFIMLQNQILQRSPKSQLTWMHGPTSNKIIDSTIGFTDASMSYTGETTSNTRKRSPDETVGVPMIGRINLHINFKISVHNLVLVVIGMSIN